MQTLVEQGDLNTACDYALKEETLAVISIAADALYPEPTNLLIHLLTAVKGPDAAFTARFHLPNGNYLYAEDEICEIFSKRSSRIHPDAINGLGRAYMRGMAPVFTKLLDEPIMNLAVAKATDLSNASSGVFRLARTEDKHVWSGPTRRAITSAVTLRRLDCEADPAAIQRMLEAVNDSMSDCPEKRRTQIALEWVLRDIRGEDFDDLIDPTSTVDLAILSDIATSHLKRSEGHRIPSLVARYSDVYFRESGFCFWPLFDYLASEGLSDISAVCDDGGYRRARRRDSDPPAWWKWA